MKNKNLVLIAIAFVGVVYYLKMKKDKEPKT